MLLSHADGWDLKPFVEEGMQELKMSLHVWKTSDSSCYLFKGNTLRSEQSGSGDVGLGNDSLD